MIPTPDLSHLKKEDYEHVYEPAEDTFILLDALEEDAEALRALKPSVCLEIGQALSGSGCVSAFLGSILGPSTTLYLCTDINTRASQCTYRTGVQNRVPLEPLLSSLAGPLRQRLERRVDVLMFNPPYVPTYDEEMSGAQDDAGIAGAWAGGTDGMRVTDVLLDQIDSLLSPNGRFYLVAVKENDVPGIQKRMQDQHGLYSEIVLHRHAGREHLYVVRFTRHPIHS
ncbi:S-adenosyl-L-methionine-dependent methyltransferase [Peniophora sp. CONT]|nr:S-adenosyl-L-methionine-dependent methyltransferase [Peniophora sp. CONT]